ncbi:MAG: phosphoglucosamine mutase [Bacteroidetes bacterium B1(2017)]|nr:MAG: phosphoglucosamine mutase [Bacteroidetes bacterium B1(2017)]
MTLIKSISGIRGTIGGKAGDALTPTDIVKFTASFGYLMKQNQPTCKIVVGRDARISGEMVNSLVCGTLMGLGIDVIDLGLSTTPTVEMAVVMEGAQGGIILTASHNPKQWNALKLLNNKGEFISDEFGKEVLSVADSDKIEFAEVDKLGKRKEDNTYIQKHIDAILAIDLVDTKAIKEKNFKIVVDAVNSTGGIAVPMLLKALGVNDIVEIYCTPDGKFPHNPEPLPENLTAISGEVKRSGADLGIVVDPDVDRLALVSEDGSMFGEEYTLVSIADYVLKNSSEEKLARLGYAKNTVSNLSSTRALRDITEKNGGVYQASAVGEVNVVKMMKDTNAVIGGEGNGGVIFPELHYGRDSLVGIALFLSHLAKYGKICSMLRESYPDYTIAKKKIELTPEINIDSLLKQVKDKYKKQPINEVDGLKIEFDKEWVHLRRSNTEPIIRIYAESVSETTANSLAEKLISDMKQFIKS